MKWCRSHSAPLHPSLALAPADPSLRSGHLVSLQQDVWRLVTVCIAHLPLACSPASLGPSPASVLGQSSTHKRQLGDGQDEAVLGRRGPCLARSPSDCACHQASTWSRHDPDGRMPCLQYPIVASHGLPAPRHHPLVDGMLIVDSLHGERPLVQQTLERTSNSYDKQRLSLFDGPDALIAGKRPSISLPTGGPVTGLPVRHPNAVPADGMLRRGGHDRSSLPYDGCIQDGRVTGMRIHSNTTTWDEQDSRQESRMDPKRRASSPPTGLLSGEPYEMPVTSNPNDTQHFRPHVVLRTNAAAFPCECCPKKPRMFESREELT